MGKTTTTIDLFEKYAQEYDALQTAIVPIYENVLSMIADTYDRYVGTGNFLDLGCGTANLALKILDCSPDSKVFLLDGSPAMLAKGAEKVKAKVGEGAIVGSKAVNLEEKGWHEGVEGPFDAIVSAFVLEHLKEDDYRSVVSQCRELLKPGGILVTIEFADDEYGMKSWFFDRMQRNIDRHKEYQHIVDESKQEERHYFVNIREKLEWLTQAGFTNVHTVWQHLFAYVVVSERVG